MPVHDWTRVGAGIFHHFHHSWIEELKRALNQRPLPADYYGLVEQLASSLELGAFTLQGAMNRTSVPDSRNSGIALAARPPKVWFRARTEVDQYADKANVIAIRHASDHRVVAMVEIVSPGNKSSRHGLRAFVEKAVELLRAGIHLLIVDLFPPRSRDPQGIHKAIWDEYNESDFALPPDKPLTLAAYIGGASPEAFVEPTAVGAVLPPMPLFLLPDEYVLVPLETTYQAAWEAVPSFWRNVLTNPS